ncbi:MAG: alpha-glucosidase C-terminal domain-containing protein [Bacteroidetes bacterium]|nr:alpha-glucosidase C-terminal domain-containing protein [Bacteroidota bacterium]
MNNQTTSIYLRFSFLFFLIILIGCKKEPEVVPPTPDPQPQQYGTPFTKVPATEDIVMYEINLRVFSSSRNIQGAIARLDSIKALGINTVWLMPIYPTASVKSVGSPYAIKDYESVNASLGTLADLRTFVEKAHELDMAVILDWVANHTAWDHEWITDKSWYAQDNAGNIIIPPGTNWQDVAELNYDNQDMRHAMIKAMKYWILEANVDGYRCDFATGVPGDFWKSAIDTLRNIPNREIIMFAESDDKTLLNADFDMVFGWPFYGKLVEIFDGQSAGQLYSTHQNEYSGLTDGQEVVRWITNHDQHAWDGTPQQIFKSEKGAMAAFVLASTMGGVPLLYNGQEVAVPQQLPFFEGNNVTINWDLNPEIKAEYKRLLQFRNQSSVLKQGNLAFYSNNDVVTFQKTSGSEEILVMVNVRNNTVNYSLPAAFANSTWKNVFTNEDVNLGNVVSLEGYGYFMLGR